MNEIAMADHRAVAGLRCAGCGAELPLDLIGPPPFRCPDADVRVGVDHLVRRVVPGDAWPAVAKGEVNPFLRYRQRLVSYHAALGAGMSDEAFVETVEWLDARVAGVAGRGFAMTPVARHAALEVRLGVGLSGALFVKDETGNVSGSHKARHLFGVLLWIELARCAREMRGLPRTDTDRFAIASCGNAALAAAVLAAAADRPLDVFVPTDVHPRVAENLAVLGAHAVVCPRAVGETGDPCYHRFREATAQGAVPFCVQGPDNGLTIEGGATLAYELLEQVSEPLDRVFVQVGGGAFASACALAFGEASCHGHLPRLPRLHAVQTAGAAPLWRAWDGVMREVFVRLGESMPVCDADRAAFVAARAADPRIRETLAWAARHRDRFMWPWESVPHSLAHGILDDETYDWLAIVEGMIRSGGWPVVASEPTIARANEIARDTTGIDVDHTGTAGLAGVLALVDERQIDPGRERIAVVFSGRRR